MSETCAPAVVSVCEATDHPWLTYGEAASGSLIPFVQGDPGSRRRQDLRSACVLNGAIYLVNRTVYAREQSFVPEGTLPYRMEIRESLDVDTPWDLHLLRLILEHPLDGETGV